MKLLVLAFTLVAISFTAARADDETSEHTAQLVGAPADTLGVTMKFDAKAGWSMDYRAKPGATEQHVALPFLPADHAHYWVVVGPGRAPITIVMSSRETVDRATPAIWVIAANGTVAKRWTMGDLFSDQQLAGLRRSVSHVRWLGDAPTLTGSSVGIIADGRAVTIDPVKRTLTR
jgi:hypothetical protein